MKCNGCGAELSAEDRFCMNCGMAQNTADGGAIPHPPAVLQETHQKSLRPAIVGLSVLAVGLLAAIAVLLVSRGRTVRETGTDPVLQAEGQDEASGQQPAEPSRPDGFNEIPEEYREELESYKRSDRLEPKASTLVSFTETADLPETVLRDGARHYSENTAIAAVDGEGEVTGLACGTTYVLSVIDSKEAPIITKVEVVLTAWEDTKTISSGDVKATFTVEQSAEQYIQVKYQCDGGTLYIGKPDGSTPPEIRLKYANAKSYDPPALYNYEGKESDCFPITEDDQEGLFGIQISDIDGLFGFTIYNVYGENGEELGPLEIIFRH